MQYATKSEFAGLNARDASRALARTERARALRRYWLGEARRALKRARAWLTGFGSCFHAHAVEQHLVWLADAEHCRDVARWFGSRAQVAS